MNDFEIQVSGKFTSLEFLIEVLLANNLAFLDQQNSDQFKSDLLSRDSYMARGVMDVDDLQKIDAACQASLSNLIRKVGEREAEIRASRAGQ